MTNASLIIVGFGLLTALTVSFFDFHRPYGVAEIRHATMRERYWLAVAGYASFELTAYVVLIGAVAAVIIHLRNSTTLDARGRPYAIGAMIAIFVLSWLSRLPVFANACGVIRTMMQTLVARYPQAMETASAIIARAQFEPGAPAREDLRKELNRYALPERLIEAALRADNRYLSAAVTRVLLEVSSLRVGFARTREDERFVGFFRARSRTCASIEENHHHLLRRVARALFVFEDLKVPDASTEELALELSEFLSEECDALKARYHKLLAELVLSALPTQEARRQLLTSFGYTVELATSLPFWPVVAVFAIYLFFPFILIFTSSGASKMSIPATGLIGFAQSWAVAIAMFLAVFPKETDFGRPTPFNLPWRSYLLYASIAFVVGTAIQFASYKMGSVFEIFLLPSDYPARTNPFSSSLLAATICIYFTIGQSILIDRRLQSGSLDYHKGRLHDALWFAGPMIVLVIALQLVFYLIPEINGRAPPFAVSELVLMTFAYLLVVFLIGFFVPSTAQAHLEATKIILSGQTSVKPIAWASRSSEPSHPLSVASGDVGR